MARRLPCSDALRGAPVEVVIDGARVRGFTGESLAVAACIAGQGVLSRSLKYHRPRGLFCLEGHCSGCLMRIDGVPNLRACQVDCDQGLTAESQNATPAAAHDLLGAVDWVFARGMDHHALMTSTRIGNALANKIVRQLSGLGRLPNQIGLAPAASHHVTADVVVIGAGPAGLAVAAITARAGLTTLVVDDQRVPGGSWWADAAGSAQAAEGAVDHALDAGAVILARSTAIGFFPEATDGPLAIATPAHLVRATARAWVWATGGYPSNAAFANNDRPGVIALRAALRMIHQHGVLAGDRVVLVTTPAMVQAADAGAALLRQHGAVVEIVAEAAVADVHGRGWVEAVTTHDGTRHECDLVVVAAVPSPASEGARQQGLAVELRPAAGGYAVVVDVDGRSAVPGAWAVGDVTGFVGVHTAARHGATVGAQVVAALAPERP